MHLAVYPLYSVSTEAGGTAESALESTVEFIPAPMRAIGAAEDAPPPAKRRREAVDSPGMRSTSWWRARYHDGSGEIGPLGPFPAAKPGVVSNALRAALGGADGVALLRKRLQRWGCPPVVYGAAAARSSDGHAERTTPLTIYGDEDDESEGGRILRDVVSPADASSASRVTPSAAPAAPASSASNALLRFPLPMCTCNIAIVATVCVRCGPLLEEWARNATTSR